MDKKTMVESGYSGISGYSILTKEMEDAGAVLVGKLDESESRPNAAFWLYNPELQEWKLVIANADVERLGPKEVYKKIQQILARSAGEILGLSLSDVALAKLDAPIISLLRMAIKTGPDISGIRFKNNVINGTLIEDAYIYRMN